MAGSGTGASYASKELGQEKKMHCKKIGLCSCAVVVDLVLTAAKYEAARLYSLGATCKSRS